MAFRLFPDGAGIDIVAPPGVFQWWDPNAARGFFKRVFDKTTPAAIAALRPRGWDAQAAHIRDVWTDLSSAYRDLTLPAGLDPGYQDAWLAQIGVAGALARRNVQTALRRMGEGGAVEAVAYVARLDADSNPVFRCLGETPREGEDCDFAGLYSGCGRYGSTVQGCEAYDMDSVAWKGGVVGPDGYNALGALAPPVWSLEIAQRAARYALERGMARLVIAARMQALQANLREARRVGAPVEELQTLVARAASALEEARYNDPAIRTAAAALATAAGVAAAIPVYGQAVGAVLALLSQLVASLPGAQGTDPATTPTYTSPVVRSGGTVAELPRYDAPQPPGGGFATDPAVPYVGDEFRVVLQTPAPGAVSIAAFNPPRGARGFVFVLTTPDGSELRAGMPATSPGTTFRDLPPGAYAARAFAQMPEGFEIASRGGAIDTTPAAAIDAAAALALAGVDCARWLAMTRPEQLAKANAIVAAGVVPASQREALIGAVTAHCFTAVRGGTTPGPAPAGVDRPANVIAQELVTLNGLSCAAWAPSSREEQIGYVRTKYPALDAAKAAAVTDLVRGYLTDCPVPPGTPDAPVLDPRTGLPLVPLPRTETGVGAGTVAAAALAALAAVWAGSRYAAARGDAPPRPNPDDDAAYTPLATVRRHPYATALVASGVAAALMPAAPGAPRGLLGTAATLGAAVALGNAALVAGGYRGGIGDVVGMRSNPEAPSGTYHGVAGLRVAMDHGLRLPLAAYTQLQTIAKRHTVLVRPLPSGEWVISTEIVTRTPGAKKQRPAAVRDVAALRNVGFTESSGSRGTTRGTEGYAGLHMYATTAAR